MGLGASGCWFGCVKGTERTCFWSHRVKMVPLATKETTVNPGKR